MSLPSSAVEGVAKVLKHPVCEILSTCSKHMYRYIKSYEKKREREGKRMKQDQKCIMFARVFVIIFIVFCQCLLFGN